MLNSEEPFQWKSRYLHGLKCAFPQTAFKLQGGGNINYTGRSLATSWLNKIYITDKGEMATTCLRKEHGIIYAIFQLRTRNLNLFMRKRVNKRKMKNILFWKGNQGLYSKTVNIIKDKGWRFCFRLRETKGQKTKYIIQSQIQHYRKKHARKHITGITDKNGIWMLDHTTILMLNFFKLLTILCYAGTCLFLRKTYNEAFKSKEIYKYIYIHVWEREYAKANGTES